MTLTYEQATHPEAQPYRLRRAKRNEWCAYCRAVILKGRNYAELSAHRWGHVICIEAELIRQSALRAALTSPEPGRAGAGGGGAGEGGTAVMVDDLKAIRLPEPDAIAILEGILADAIRLGKAIADLRGSVRGEPIITHTLETMAFSCMTIVNITERRLAERREGSREA